MYKILVILLVAQSVFALLPPNCVVKGTYKEYYKENDKTRTRNVEMKLNYENSTLYPWTRFDFGKEGRLSVTIGMKGRANTLDFTNDNGSLQGVDLLRLVQTVIPKKDRSKASMLFKYWYNNSSYCNFLIDNLKAY